MHDLLLFLLQEPRLLALCLSNPLTSILHKNRHTSLHLHLCLARDEGYVGNEVCGYQGLGNGIFFTQRQTHWSLFLPPTPCRAGAATQEGEKKH